MNSDFDPIPEETLRKAVSWHHRLVEAPGDDALKAAFSSWLDADAQNARAWAQSQSAWQLAGDLVPATSDSWDTPDTTEPASTADRVIAGPWQRTRRLIALGAVAAIAACLLILVTPYDPATWFQADHITATGETRTVTLQDGSVVTLNADSAIRTDFSAGKRSIDLLRGEAFFQVTHDAARPFVVGAETMTVTVTGTAFTVGITDERLSVSVEDGSVDVSNAGAPATPTALTRGQRAVLDRRTGMLALGTVSPGTVASWRSGRLVVENVALSDVVDALARHHSGAIVIASPSLGDKRVTGVYDLADPARALRALAGPYGGVVREVTPFLLTVSTF